MKATKQLTSSIIAAALALLLATPAMAATAGEASIEHPQTAGNTQITAGVNQSYTLVIPETMTFNNLYGNSDAQARTQAFDVTATSVVLAPGKTLEVSVQGDNQDGAFLLPNTANDSLRLPYSVYSGDSETPLDSGDTFATFATSTATQTQSGAVVVDRPTMGAGTYQGNLTFVCNVVQQAGTKE